MGEGRLLSGAGCDPAPFGAMLLRMSSTRRLALSHAPRADDASDAFHERPRSERSRKKPDEPKEENRRGHPIPLRSFAWAPGGIRDPRTSGACAFRHAFFGESRPWETAPNGAAVLDLRLIAEKTPRRCVISSRTGPVPQDAPIEFPDPAAADPCRNFGPACRPEACPGVRPAAPG